MKITYIVKLIIIFYTAHLFGFDDQQKVLDKVKAQTHKAGKAEITFIEKSLKDNRLLINNEVIKRFKEKPEKIKTYEQYKKIFVNKERIEGGAKFFEKNKKLLSEISKEFSIDPIVLVAIVGVETNYGSKTSGFTVINSLYTQAAKMPKRSTWAAKEIAELLSFCYQNNIDPYSIEGSYAGAFGYGQFIPSSFNRLSIDYNKDGEKDPYDWEDVLGSVAYYLVENGYPKNSFNFSYKSGIWHAIRTYNRSDKYANAIIDLRNEISREIFLSH